MLSNASLGAKVGAGLLAVTLVGASGTAFGLYAISAIDRNLNEITDVAAPTVETSADVMKAVKEAHKVAAEILADEDVASIRRRMEEFDAARQDYDAALTELNEIVVDPALESTLATAERQGEAFFSAAQRMFAATKVELDEERLAYDQLAELEAEGVRLTEALDAVSQANEAEMQAAEDEADRLAALPGTTPAQLNDLIGELFERDYPAVEAAIELEAIVALMESAAREFMAEEDAGALDALREEFRGDAARAKAHFAVLRETAETDADRTSVDALEDRFNAWFAGAQADEQLFDTHGDMLTAEAEADALAERTDDAADALVGSLDQVVSAADAVSDSADEV
ncbi:MAG: hypothetical protein AAF676_15770, partial [Pseudomonadota bacterium]